MSINLREAIAHNRKRKDLLREEIKETVQSTDFSHCKSFMSVFEKVYKLVRQRDIGMLTIQDITTEICIQNKIKIYDVYVNGNGPQNALKKIGMKEKYQYFEDTRGKKVYVKYVTLTDLKAFVQRYRYRNKDVQFSDPDWTNANEVENWLCSTLNKV